MKKHQVLLITNIPTPYRIPLFNELNSQLDAQGISFKVVFAALTYPRRKWAIEMSQCTFPYVVLNSRRLMSKNPESAIFTYYGLGQILRDNPNALLITSGFSLATIRIYLRSLYRRTNYLIWSGAINRKGRPDSWLRNFQRRRMISRASGFIAYGKRAHNYLVDLGADRSRIFIGINTIDTTYFFRESSRLRLENGSKDSLTKSILYIGNLETGKRLDYLLKAVHLLAGSRNDFRLEIVGTGSQEVHLKQLAQRLGIGHLVCFHGFAQQDTVVRYLSKAFCFAFPSEYDVWGLVLI
jgi:glycosyltransferase involved in cell wall biosynthesis